MNKPNLSIVIPLLNEEDNIDKLYVELMAVLKPMSCKYEILFIDDGSTDESFIRILQIKKLDPNVRGISFSRNFGHQAALAAGIAKAKGDVIISMDADLQHPPSLIPDLYAKHLEGFEIVNTKRIETEDAGQIKKITSTVFYKIINSFSDIRIEPGAADFRLITKKVAEAFLEIKEKDRFTRGLVSWMGFSQAFIIYNAPSRTAGVSKYTFSKMLKFAISGITSFSSKPLRLALYSGFMVSLIALVYSIFAIISNIQGKTIPGWTSILLSVLFIGGIQLITLGIFGEYLGKIFIEIKNRPLYIINKTSDDIEI
ncbi:MAG: glycosyltransferase family 2 protein [Bacteroidota bacterium]